MANITADATQPVLTSILQNRNINRDQFFSPVETVFATEQLNLPAEDAILIQAQTLINETLQNITSSQQTELLFNEALSDLTFSQQAQLLSRSRILINESLRNIGAAENSALLIEVRSVLNEIFERLNTQRQEELITQTGTILNEALQDLGPPQQAAVLIQAETIINDTLLTLAPPPLTIEDEESIFPIINRVNDFQNLNAAPNDALLTGLTTAEEIIVTEAQNQTPIEIQNQNINQNTQTVVQNTPVTAQPLSDTTAASTVVTTEVSSANRQYFLEPFDPIPFGVAVYELNNLKNSSVDPEPIDKTVKPAPPVEKSGLINHLLLKTMWGENKESGRHIYIPESQMTEEGIIRKIISQFNEDQVKKNQPVHLVLAKNEDGLFLDIYDCSDTHACQLVYDAHLASNELPTLINNLRNDTGAFVNTFM